MTRRTLAAATSHIEGVGLFTAAPARVRFAPAGASGMPGIAIAVNGREAFPATIAALHTQPLHPAFAQMPARSTNLAGASGVAATVEHAMAALAGLGVTDAVIEIETGAPGNGAAGGPVAELPILDGSAQDFVRAIRSAGLAEVPADRASPKPIAPEAVVEVVDGPASIRLEPAEGFSCVYELDYSGVGPVPPIAAQRVEWSGDADRFASDIAPARTFSLAPEAQAMQAAGLCTHLTPREMLVLNPATADAPASPIDNELRFSDEPARHKLLDLIGDLALAGAPIRGRVVAHRSGHATTHAFVRALLTR